MNITNTYAPVALFVYNRPLHTRRTLEALSKNTLASQSTVYVFADGPKPGASPEERRQIEAVRKIVKSQTWTSIELIASDENKGLANSVIHGVTQVLAKHGKVVVLEDDMVTGPNFLTYMNEALEKYEHDERVISATAYIYPVKGIQKAFFLRGADCWGWATWKRGWDLFEPDGSALLKQLEENGLTHSFDFDGSFPYTQMLKDQIAGTNDSWAIRWYASAFLKNKLTLYPPTTLLLNIGIDGSGTHSGANKNYETELVDYKVDLNVVEVKEDTQARNKVASFFRDGKKGPLLSSKWKHLTKRIQTLITPPIVSKIGEKYISPLVNGKPVPVFSGDYGSWDSARQYSSGYEAGNIVTKVREATLQVLNGEAAFERDSVLFYKMEHTWPLLAVLLRIGMENHGTLSVLDFGGALGSMYFQNRHFLSPLGKLEWSVVEQANYVEEGRKYILHPDLKFYHSIEEARRERQPQVLLLANVTQYMQDPHAFLDEIVGHGFETIVFESTAFIESNRDRLTVQNVPEHIYKASYPAWFLNEKKFLNHFKAMYSLHYEFYSTVNPPEWIEGGKVYWKGFVFKKVKN